MLDLHAHPKPSFLRKRIEVISDDEAEIVEAARRLVARYDFVVTSGGIGPTHDGSSFAIYLLRQQG